MIFNAHHFKGKNSFSLPSLNMEACFTNYSILLPNSGTSDDLVYVKVKRLESSILSYVDFNQCIIFSREHHSNL